MPGSCVIVGSGRAGASFDAALTRVGWTCELVRGRSNGLGLLDGVDLILLAVPDVAIADAAASIAPTAAVVAHVSGACDLDVLAPHERVGSIHPLVSLPNRETGALRLLDRCAFAVDGDPLMAAVVADLGGRAIDVPGSKRVLYHATAAVAANHLAALAAQVESLAAEVGVPVDAYWRLMSTTLDNIADVGPAAALTGPAARGDWGTIRSHLAALPTDADRKLYLALCEQAAHMAGHSFDAAEFARRPR